MKTLPPGSRIHYIHLRLLCELPGDCGTERFATSGVGGRSSTLSSEQEKKKKKKLEEIMWTSDEYPPNPPKDGRYFHSWGR